MKEIEKLKEKTVKSMVWKGAERFFAQIVSTIIAIVLARILMPEDYSVVSIVTIFFSFCNIFISGGINSALIQKKDSDELDYSTVLVTNLFIAAVLYVIMFSLAPFIAKIYEKTILTSVIRVMALTFFINGYKAVLCAKISSSLQFKKFFLSTIVGTIISAVVGIVMALKGFGAWALVAQQMTNSFVDAIILTVTTKIKFSFSFSKERFNVLFSYGGRLFLANLITTFYNQLKPLIVGVRYTPSDLAFYKKGETFPSLINTLTSNTLAAVLFPAMSKLQDDRNLLLNAVRRYLRVGSFLIFPAMLGFFAISDNFIRVVLTEKWLPISPYLKVFCIVYLFNLIQIGNIQATQAIGRSDIILKTEILKKSTYFIVIILFVLFTHNPVMLAASEIICYIVATIINVYPNKKEIGFKYRYLFEDLFTNLITAVIMCIVVYLMNMFNINVVLLLFLQVIFGGIVYVILNIIIKNDSLFYVLNMMKKYLPKNG